MNKAEIKEVSLIYVPDNEMECQETPREKEGCPTQQASTCFGEWWKITSRVGQVKLLWCSF